MEKEEKQKVNEPHVRIFNKDVGREEKVNKSDKKTCTNCAHLDKRCHKPSHSALFGLTVLFIGVIFLLINLQIVPRNIWFYIVPFWPILLILAGIKMIFSFSRVLTFLVFLIAFSIFCGIFTYGLMQVGSPLAHYIYLPQGFNNFISKLN